MTERALVYFEDLQPGQVHRSSGPPAVVDAESIKTYARQFDPQPFHLDEQLAADTFFKGLAASGWHTMSLTMRLLVEGGLPLAGGIIGGAPRRFTGRARCGRATGFGSKARCSRCGRCGLARRNWRKSGPRRSTRTMSRSR
jgi:acyl dehydratase